MTLEVDEIEVAADVTALQLLQAVYRSPQVPLPVRMRAARDALPFESPKLAVIGHLEGGLGDRLDKLLRTYQRSGVDPRVIEHQPRVIEPPNIAKPMTTSVPDRRFRRV